MNTYLFGSQFGNSKVQMCDDWVLCSGSLKAETKVLARLHSHLEFRVPFQAYMTVKEFSSLWL